MIGDTQLEHWGDPKSVHIPHRRCGFMPLTIAVIISTR